jgi:hypothetical protein
MYRCRGLRARRVAAARRRTWPLKWLLRTGRICPVFHNQVGLASTVDSGVRDPGVACTHAFGNTEERLIRMVLGVAAREGDRRWDSSSGSGAVAFCKGNYHDAIHVKRNTVDLRIHNLPLARYFGIIFRILGGQQYGVYVSKYWARW